MFQHKYTCGISICNSMNITLCVLCLAYVVDDYIDSAANILLNLRLVVFSFVFSELISETFKNIIQKSFLSGYYFFPAQHVQC